MEYLRNARHMVLLFAVLFLTLRVPSAGRRHDTWVLSPLGIRSPYSPSPVCRATSVQATGYPHHPVSYIFTYLSILGGQLECLPFSTPLRDLVNTRRNILGTVLVLGNLETNLTSCRDGQGAVSVRLFLRTAMDQTAEI